jgi:segregation and condensation protein B
LEFNLVMSRDFVAPEKAKQVLEALLLATDEPISAARLAQLLNANRAQTAADAAPEPEGKPHRMDAHAVRKLLDELNAEYTAQGRAFEVVEIAGGFQLLTRPEYKEWVAELHRNRRQEKLSQSAVETLAIVAYRQPVQRATVDDVRGVQSGPLLRSLHERGLVKVVGRQNVPGRPILYGTSRRFLEHFGLKSIKDLPRVAELTPP